MWNAELMKRTTPAELDRSPVQIELKIWEERTWAMRVSHPSRQDVHVWLDYQPILDRRKSPSISAQRLEVLIVPMWLAREKNLL
jgi:hypothetical protein